LSDTVAKAGVATASTGKAIQAIGSIPLVGATVGNLGAQAVAAGHSAEVSGRSSKTTIDQLAVLLGLAVGLIPTVPLLALYLPLRRSWRRDRRAVGQAVAQWDGEPGLEEFLARRALAHLPYHELRDLADEGSAAFDDGARDRLAAAELHRLGLDGSSRRILRFSRFRERARR
ncbi:MAG: hypothetical protein ACRDLK_14140, partial [Gaiellaceae bacterium]